jgi:hypothetical protein
MEQVRRVVVVVAVLVADQQETLQQHLARLVIHLLQAHLKETMVVAQVIYLMVQVAVAAVELVRQELLQLQAQALMVVMELQIASQDHLLLTLEVAVAVLMFVVPQLMEQVVLVVVVLVAALQALSLVLLLQEVAEAVVKQMRLVVVNLAQTAALAS